MLQGEQARKEKSLGGRAVLQALRSNLSLLGELAARTESGAHARRASTEVSTMVRDKWACGWLRNSGKNSSNRRSIQQPGQPTSEKIAKLLGGDKSVGSVADFDIRGLDYPGSHYEFGACGTGFTAVDGGFGAPFLGQAAHPLVDGFVEAQQIAYHPPVQQGTVGVGVGQVSGH